MRDFLFAFRTPLPEDAPCCPWDEAALVGILIVLAILAAWARWRKDK